MLLVRPEELQAGRVVLQGRRAEHVVQLLRKQPGDPLRVGVLERGVSQAEVVSVHGEPARVVVEVPSPQALPQPRSELLCAIPRPKALSRLLQHVTSFGVRRVSLVRTARVEASYLASKRLAQERLAQDVWLGLEQGAQVHPPELSVYGSLPEALEALESRCDAPAVRVNLEPAAKSNLFLAVRQQSTDPNSRTALLLGPDGGVTGPELDLLRAHAFEPAHLGGGILRTEVAASAALAQLELCRELLARLPHADAQT